MPFQKIRILFAATFTLSALLVIVGCNSSPAPSTNPQPDAQASSNEDSEAAEIAEAFAKLSDEDRAAAEKQKICPVSEAKLGTMGTPIKVDVNGQQVFICCEGCADPLKSKPDDYLAKLPK